MHIRLARVLRSKSISPEVPTPGIKIVDVLHFGILSKNAYQSFTKFDETEVYPKILKQIVKKSKKYVDKIIIIDDGSSKNIKIDCTIIKNIKNKGKGFSIRKAIKFVGKSDIIIFMDADNEHDPKDLPKFLNKFKSNKFQGLVIGKRRQYRSPLRKILNNWMNFWIGFIIKKADFSCGFRAIDISSLKKFI